MTLISAEQLLRHRDLESFSEASVFGAVSQPSILWLLEHGKLHRLQKGDSLFSRGEPGDSFHVILEGQVSYYKFHEGNYAYVKDYHAGEEIGFVSMIALHERVGRCEACCDTTTLEIDSALFLEFHNQGTLDFGILMMNLAREMARTIRSIGNILVEKEHGESAAD